MQIYVCVKHVPDTAATIRVIGGTGFDESVKFVMNPYDEYAVEQALRVRQQQGTGEVVVVSVGKPAAMSAIRSALAVGADRGILVKTDRQFLDSAVTSQALAKVIRQDGAPDLIFTGKQSVDTEGMQTHFRLAAALDLPVATDVVAFTMTDGKVVVEREIGGGTRESIEMTLPCVVGATRGLNEPRYPKLSDIMKARKKQVREMDLEELGVQPAPSGAPELVALEAAPERGEARMLLGTPREMAEQLLEHLRNEAKVL